MKQIMITKKATRLSSFFVKTQNFKISETQKLRNFRCVFAFF